MIMNPVKSFLFSFVDDLSVCSNHWNQHLAYLRAFLTEIRESGLTLNVKKCSFAKPKVKFIGPAASSQNNFFSLFTYTHVFITSS